jgi:hypothetical protein
MQARMAGQQARRRGAGKGAAAHLNPRSAPPPQPPEPRGDLVQLETYFAEDGRLTTRRDWHITDARTGAYLGAATRCARQERQLQRGGVGGSQLGLRGGGEAAARAPGLA